MKPLITMSDGSTVYTSSDSDWSIGGKPMKVRVVVDLEVQGDNERRVEHGYQLREFDERLNEVKDV